MFCDGVKEFLSQSGIEFVDRDITADDSAMDELKGLGLMTTPVTVIDGVPVVGFDQAKLKELLGLS
jgi:glutaredoxin